MQAAGNVGPGEQEHFGTGFPQNPGLHRACGCRWDELGLQLHRAEGLCPCPGAGLGWRIPLNYFQMGINAAKRVCCRIDKQTKAPQDAINKPSACCFCPRFGNILALSGVQCALPCCPSSPLAVGQRDRDSSGTMATGVLMDVSGDSVPALGPHSGCKWDQELPAVSPGAPVPTELCQSSGTGRCPLSSPAFSSQALGGFGVSVNRVGADFEPHGTGTAMPGGEQTSFGWLQVVKLTFAMPLVGGLLCHPPCAHRRVPLLRRRKVAHGV